MKKLALQSFILFFLIIIFSDSFSQVPQKMSYQAVIRNSSNVLVSNQQVSMRISILQGTETGTAKYVETQAPTTNINGLVSIQIGSGTVVSGALEVIDWSTGPYFIKTETDPTGGSAYSIVGVSELLSVPYALHAKIADSVIGGSSGENKYKIGDFAQGGIIFWLDSTGMHGLACSLKDIPEQSWYNGYYHTTNATRDGIYAGEWNTSQIIASQTNDNPTGNFAALACAKYSVTDNGIPYGDWYLASKYELSQMYLNRDKINASAVANGGVGFNPTFLYWSSTEAEGSGGNNAWYQQMSLTGIVSNDLKMYALQLRPIRRF